MVIGIFEFTMMRTGGALPYDRWARLFRDYLEEGGLYRANFGDGQKVSLMRAVPHDGSIAAEDYVEVLDYEKAAAIIDAADRFAIGICSCRHEHEHAGGRTLQGAARHLLDVRRDVGGIHGAQRARARGLEGRDAGQPRPLARPRPRAERRQRAAQRQLHVPLLRLLLQRAARHHVATATPTRW